MGQFRNGYFTTPSSAAAQTVNLAFEPDIFVMRNYTGYAANGVISQIIYNKNMPSGNTLVQTVDTSISSPSALIKQTVNSGTLISVAATGGSWATTQASITGISKANPGVVTVSAVGNLAEGDTVTISNVVGMIQVNTNRYIVTNFNSGAKTFQLYDLFGNPVNTSSYTTYSSGGIVNIISTSATPPGNQYDTGAIVVTMASGAFRENADLILWEAYYETPTGY